MSRLFAALLLLVALVPPLRAQQLLVGDGVLPLSLGATVLRQLTPDHDLLIEGVVEGEGNATVVVRLDDARSVDYASRFNGERILPAGPFVWRINGRGLRTPTGRPIDVETLHRLILFTGAKQRVRVRRLAFVLRSPLPNGAIGLSFGQREAELAAGFERVEIGDTRIAGRTLTAIHRPGVDPLLASGIRGVDVVRVPWSRGRARVTVWTEDVGEWEWLPHSLERRVHVNGTEAFSERHTADSWIARRYLGSEHVEHSVMDDAWSAFGSRRGGQVSILADPHDGAFLIKFSGSNREATYVSALLIEPEGTDALDVVTRDRQSWYRSNWPVVLDEPRRQTAVVHLNDGMSAPPSLRRVTGRNSGVRLTVHVQVARDLEVPDVRLEDPTNGTHQLAGRIWSSQTRLTRKRAGDTVLTLSDTRLSPSHGMLPIRAGVGRTVEAWLDVPADTPPGRYLGHIVVDPATPKIPFTIEVLDVVLEPASKPSGFYLDEAPHLTWFSADTADRNRQAACDLDFFAWLRLRGSAPPLATPDLAPGQFEDDMRRAAVSGVASPWLAYAPGKRLLQSHGEAGSAERIATTATRLATQPGGAPVWSVFDEPSNPNGLGRGALLNWIRTIRAQAPHALLAGQFNTQRDHTLLAHVDVALINGGYGLDIDDIGRARQHVRHVWLYNTDAPRATAGVWLWRTPAERYLQWHGRMPTADPLDPIDGREGDVQALWPTREVCPPTPTIDRSVLDMADGMVDQQWLDALSRLGSSAAQTLAARLRARLEKRWMDVARMGTDELDAIRESVIELHR